VEPEQSPSEKEEESPEEEDESEAKPAKGKGKRAAPAKKVCLLSSLCAFAHGAVLSGGCQEEGQVKVERPSSTGLAGFSHRPVVFLFLFIIYVFAVEENNIQSSKDQQPALRDRGWITSARRSCGASRSMRKRVSEVYPQEIDSLASTDTENDERERDKCDSKGQTRERQ
jgi:hypothetical protein